jgi:hypothetical protein
MEDLKQQIRLLVSKQLGVNGSALKKHRKPVKKTMKRGRAMLGEAMLGEAMVGEAMPKRRMTKKKMSKDGMGFGHEATRLLSEGVKKVLEFATRKKKGKAFVLGEGKKKKAPKNNALSEFNKLVKKYRAKGYDFRSAQQLAKREYHNM